MLAKRIVAGAGGAERRRPGARQLDQRADPPLPTHARFNQLTRAVSALRDAPRLPGRRGHHVLSAFRRSRTVPHRLPIAPGNEISVPGPHFHRVSRESRMSSAVSSDVGTGYFLCSSILVVTSQRSPRTSQRCAHQERPPALERPGGFRWGPLLRWGLPVLVMAMLALVAGVYIVRSVGRSIAARRRSAEPLGLTCGGSSGRPCQLTFPRDRARSRRPAVARSLCGRENEHRLRTVHAR